MTSRSASNVTFTDSSTRYTDNEIPAYPVLIWLLEEYNPLPLRGHVSDERGAEAMGGGEYSVRGKVNADMRRLMIGEDHPVANKYTDGFPLTIR